MVQDLLLGIDIGTQGVKASLFDSSGTCRGSAFIPSRLHQPAPGVTEEEPEFQLDSVCRSISECLKSLTELDKKAVRCIAIDGQMAGIIGIDEDGKALTPYDSWLDTRCAPYIEKLKNAAEEEIIKKTGNPPSFNHGPKILWWKHERKDVYKQVASFVQPGGYAAMRLCGLKGKDAFIDKTYLHFSGFADNRNARWDEDLLRLFDVEVSKLPRIVSSTEIIGTMTKEMSLRCGLPAPVPVAAGCGDTAASFLSCGAVKPGICIDVAGTASVFAATTDRFSCDLKYQAMGCGASVTEGLWHPYAYINGGGMNVEWFLSEIMGRDKSDPERFRGLDNEQPDLRDDSPMFIPHMSGRVSPSQPALKGTFSDLSWRHRSIDMFFAVMEAVALEYGIYRDALESMLPGYSISEMRITGGGERNTAWKLMKSGVLQVPVVSINQNYGAPMGAAIVAGAACGILTSAGNAAESWISTKDAVICEAEYYSHFEKRLKKYRRLLDTMNNFYSN